MLTSAIVTPQPHNSTCKVHETQSMVKVIARLSLSQDQNVFDSKKKVKLTNAEGVEYKLVRKQLQAIEFNKALLAMYTNQVGPPKGRAGEGRFDH